MNLLAQKFHCLIVAAGSGERMGANLPKQYISIGNQTLLELSLQPFLGVEEIQEVLVVLAAGDTQFSKLPIARHPKIRTVVGGKARCHSVLAGLNALCETADESDWVMVHDAARPNISTEDIYRLMNVVADHPVGGLLGVPVADSLKKVNAAQAVEVDLPRDQVWRAFTPQCFRLGLLKQSLESALEEGELVSDEASAVSRMGVQPLMVEGRADNIKVTRPSDLQMLKAFKEAELEIDSALPA